MTAPASAAVGDGSLRRARWSQVAAYVVIGVALAGTAMQSFLTVRAASQAVSGAQGESLMRPIRHAQRPGESPSQSTLQKLVDRYDDLGLRCIAMFGRDGKDVVLAGDCQTPPAEIGLALLERRPARIVDVGARVRMVGRLPPPPPGRRRDPLEDLGVAGLDDLWEESRPPPPHPEPVLIEFEPVMANRLRAGAIRSLVVGLFAMLTLVGASLVLWRLSKRTERLQEELANDRRLVALGEMSAVLAHEIRNPLASLKGHAQLLAERFESDEPERRKAERIVHEAVRLEGLCEDLLSLVRSNRVELANTDAAALLREAAAVIGADRVLVSAPDTPPRWQLDPRRMHQVLVNLLRNADQASPEARPTEASVRVEAGWLHFTVRDFGVGIDPGEEDRIFEPFHTTRIRGTGLGLAVVKRIVELHQGSVTARNHPQGGAEFCVRLPRT